ncbi:MAG TPA: hypothetical protein VHQ21_13810 [Rhodanobacteraceae bacterium]|jgi:hypothetical protein|nr:hypothetical protein [Rhodanobacteraceae bacterium]
MSSNEKLEREFAAFLAEDDSRLAALYRKLPQDEPGPRLDGAVRAMAHRALNPQLVATPQAASASRRRGRWVPALGAAAGIVFAAGIAFRLGPSWHGDRGETGAPASDVISVRSVDAPPPTAPPLSPAPPPAESAASPAAAASPSGMAKLKAQAETEAAKPASDAEAREKSAKLDDNADNRPSAAGGLSKVEKPAVARAQPQAFPPAPARKRASEIDAVEHKQIMATGAWQNLHDRDDKRPGSPAQAAPPSAATHPMTAAKSADPRLQEALPAAPAPPAQSSALAPSSRDKAVSPPAAPAPVPEQFAPPPPARATAAPPTQADAQRREDGTRDTAGAPAASAEQGQKKENEKTRSKDPNARLYPEHWLENIRAMLREDNRDGAVRSLAEFRKMYPDYKLPDDLRDLK